MAVMSVFRARVALVMCYFVFEQVSSSELTNGVINTAFLMLYKVKLCVVELSCARTYTGIQFQ
jgi:hypothetical protein